LTPISLEISGRLIGPRLLKISNISIMRFSFSLSSPLCKAVSHIARVKPFWCL